VGLSGALRQRHVTCAMAPVVYRPHVRGSEATSGPRTLLVTSRLPWPVRGGHDIRIDSMLRVLVRHRPVFVFALAGGSGPPSFEGLVGWQATNDPSTTRPLKGRKIGEWLRAGGSPYASRYSAAVADALSDVVRAFDPDVIIAGPLDVSPYVPLLRESAEHLVLEADQNERDLLLAIANEEESRPHALVRRLVAERVGQAEADTMALVDQIWVASDHEATMQRRRRHGAERGQH
jgi:hypothetical protein